MVSLAPASDVVISEVMVDPRAVSETAGSGYTVTVLRGNASMSGSGDRASTQGDCNPMP